jgi:hypothetical protein
MCVTSDSHGIHFVVLAMRADEPNEYHAPVVMHGGDETIVVALNVERAKSYGPSKAHSCAMERAQKRAIAARQR